MLKDDELLAQIEDDWRTAELGTGRMAMLSYCEKLTLQPGEMVKGDVLALREAGFSDRDVLEIAEVTAYYAYVNRIADGLGVELEDDQRAPPREPTGGG